MKRNYMEAHTMTIRYARLFMALVLGLALVAISGGLETASAKTLEYPYIYKSPRIMAMGGTNVAIGGDFAAIFHNPAALIRMPEGNWQVNLIGANMAYSSQAQDMIDDLDAAYSTPDLNGDGDPTDDQQVAVNKVLEAYKGKNMHFSLSDLTSVAANNGKLALGFGFVAKVSSDTMSHQGFGSDALAEVHTALDTGFLIGASYASNEQLNIGFGLKLINREAVNHSFSSRELVQNQQNLENFLTEDLQSSEMGVGLDFGVLYDIGGEDSTLHPAVGMSILNLGGLDFGDAGEVPMTVNIGFAIRPEIQAISGVAFGVDYVDVLNAYEQDGDMAKRLRLGGEVVLYDGTFATLGFRGGLYQGYPSYGVNLTLAVVKLSYSSYTEEIGAYAGQEKDKRQLLSLNIGW